MPQWFNDSMIQSFSDLFRCLPEPLFQFVDLAVQTFGKVVAKLGKVIPDRWYFGKPALHVHAEQLSDVRGRKVKSIGIRVRSLGTPADRRVHSVHFAIAAFEDPLQHSAVLAVSGPKVFAVVVGAEPVDVIDFGQLCTRPVPDLEIVGEVIAHVVATERKHGHRVTAKFADFAGGGRGGFAADGRAQKSPMLPIEGLSHQRNNARSAATEKDSVDRNAVGVLPLRGNHRALTGGGGGARLCLWGLPGQSSSPLATQPDCLLTSPFWSDMC